MKTIKTFNEWINESASSGKIVDYIYQALVDAGFGDAVFEPTYDDDFPVSDEDAELYGIRYSDDVDYISFKEGSIDFDKFIFYGIYVINEVGSHSASIIILYGEDDYTDGPEPWHLYYSSKYGIWKGDGPIHKIINIPADSDLRNILSVISKEVK